MFEIFLFYIFAGVAVSSPAANPANLVEATTKLPPDTCGFIPLDMYLCLGNPKLISQDVAHQCDLDFSSECDGMRCILNGQGWLKDNKIDKAAISTSIKRFVREFPDWTDATVYIKEQCLDKQIPPQGIKLNCPEYDIMHCIFTGFLMTAKSSQWATSPSCERAKSFAAACPACPNNCFVPEIPIGSCNACHNYPKM